jgi:hypothetical protein
LSESRSFRSSFNRAVRNLEGARKIKCADIIIEGVKIRAFRLPDWPKRRREIAYHEAGHAVLAEKLHFRVDIVTIKPHRFSRRSLGQAVHAKEARGGIRAEDRIICSLAGPIAEAESIGHLYNRRRDLRGSDLASVRLEEELSGVPLRELEAQTLRMVRKEWSRIERVANALLKKEELFGHEVRDILKGEFKLAPQRGAPTCRKRLSVPR